METKQIRAYSGKDVDMLTVSATITDSAIKNKAVLVAKRSNWADPFFQNLKARITAAFSNLLGIDNAKQMREATLIVVGLQKKALSDLAEFKVQVMEDFKGDRARRDEILTTLGFTPFLKAARAKDQEALIELLHCFKTNMTAALQTEIAAAGTSPALITTIVSYADTLKDSNITQETFKGTRVEISQAAVAEFNGIYSEVISVSRIASKFFKDNKAIRDQFSYTKVKSHLNKVKHPIGKPGDKPLNSGNT